MPVIHFNICKDLKSEKYPGCRVGVSSGKADYTNWMMAKRKSKVTCEQCLKYIQIERGEFKKEGFKKKTVHYNGALNPESFKSPVCRTGITGGPYPKWIVTTEKEKVNCKKCLTLLGIKTREATIPMGEGQQKEITAPVTRKEIFTKYERCKPENYVMQFKIELPEILPSIWRRILVPSDYNFWDLHVAIQDSLGWLDYHLHEFKIREKHKREDSFYGIPDYEGNDEDSKIKPGWEHPILYSFSKLGMQARYEYDFGDRWWHIVTFEGQIHWDKKQKYPKCIGGERACPPEDCGGVGGYYNVLEILSQPEHEEYKTMREWVGEKWNSDHFVMDEVKFDDPLKRWRKAFQE